MFYRLLIGFKLLVRLQHLQKLFESWVPRSVFSAGSGRSSVEAWYSTALDFEESLSGALDSDVHICVADVVKSVEHFEYHARFRRRFKLSCGLGGSCTRDGGIPQGCPLSMVFIVALYLPWCRHLESVRGVRPQLYADNLKCVSSNDDDLVEAA